MLAEIIKIQDIQFKDLSKAKSFEIIVTQEELNKNKKAQLENIDNLMSKLEKKGINARQSVKLVFSTDDDKLSIYKNDLIRSYVSMIFDRYPHFLYFAKNENQNSKKLLLFLSNTNIEKQGESDEYKLSIELEEPVKRKMLYATVGFGYYTADTEKNIKKVIADLFY